jgi:RNA polymerase sigma-70 factor (ECF subfamily)
LGAGKLSDNKAKVRDQSLPQQTPNNTDCSSFGSLYAMYYPPIRRYVASRIGSVADTDDLAQSVFLEFCETNCSGKAYRNVEGYLFGIARNLIRQYWRAKRKEPRTCCISRGSSIPAHGVAERQQESAERISLQQLVRVIEDAGSELTPKLRQALELRFLDGHKPREAAQEAGCSVWTFYKRLDKAAKVLERVARKDVSR